MNENLTRRPVATEKAGRERNDTVMEKKLVNHLQLALGVIALLWVIHAADWLMPMMDLRTWGIRPRRISGLWGIAFCPFLHVDWRHLATNSGTLFILLTMSLSFDRKLTAMAIAIIMGLGGFAVWLFGEPNSVHVGASGVIFGLIGFLMFVGLFRRRWDSVLVSVVTAVAYGGAFRALFVYQAGVSFSSHLFGFLAGVLAAWWLRGART